MTHIYKLYIIYIIYIYILCICMQYCAHRTYMYMYNVMYIMYMYVCTLIFLSLLVLPKVVTITGWRTSHWIATFASRENKIFPHFSVPVLAEISSSLLRKSMNRLDTGFTSSHLIENWNEKETKAMDQHFFFYYTCKWWNFFIITIDAMVLHVMVMKLAPMFWVQSFLLLLVVGQVDLHHFLSSNHRWLVVLGLVNLMLNCCY